MTTARAALRTAMLAWREALAEIAWIPPKSHVETSYVAACEQSADSAQIFWLACDVAHSAAAMEAAELFALLPRVDLALWKETARAVWPYACEWADYIETRTSVRVGVDVQVEYRDADLAAVCIQAAEYLRATRTSNYRSTRALMARVLRVPRGSLPMVPMRINHIVDDHFDTSIVPQMLADVLGVLQSLSPVQNTAIRVTEFKTETVFTTVNEDAIKSLLGIQALGIQVTDLPMIQVATASQNLQTSLKSVRILLDASAYVPQEAAEKSRYVTRSVSRSTGSCRVTGAEKIAVYGTLPDQLTSSIFSAVHASRSLRAVDVNFNEPTEGRAAGGDASRRRFMSWMAYALFCRPPLSAIDVAADHLCAADVEWMKEIVTARNPLALLFPEEATSEWPRVAVTPQVFLYDPHERHSAMPQATWVEPTACMYQVLGESRSGYLAVLVPGWGKAWIREETATISACSASEFRSPIHIVFRFMQIETMDAVLALLRLIGHDLKHLRIEDCWCPNTPLDEFIEKVIFACPNLEELELSHMDLTNFQFIIDASNAKRFPVLKNLSLFAISVRDRDAVERLLDELTHPRGRMAIQLRSLHLLTLGSERSSTTIPETALRMLSINSRLRDVSLGFTGLPKLAADVQSRFESHNLSIVSEPLPLRSVLAFLSVVASARDAGGDHAMEQFDSHICSQIVSFAASPRIRRVEYSAR